MQNQRLPNFEDDEVITERDPFSGRPSQRIILIPRSGDVPTLASEEHHWSYRGFLILALCVIFALFWGVSTMHSLGLALSVIAIVLTSRYIGFQKR